MNSQLFIADRIKVGFQKRSDTFTGQLAYVVYYDANGKLRKEKSWEGWRDKKIDPQELDNTPQTGFMINKGITRGGDWFGDTTTKVRIWDPRGFEFEISVPNLMQILMHSDVSKRDIAQACVYAWSGTELILLPTNSDVFESSVRHTAKQAVKFSAKDLVVGYTYNVKQGNDKVVYLGRHDYYAQVDMFGKRIGYSTRTGFKHSLKPKKHVFYNVTNQQIMFNDPVSLIAGLNSDIPNTKVATYLDKFYTLMASQPVKSIISTKPGDKGSGWYQLSDTEFVFLKSKFEVKTKFWYNHKAECADPAARYEGFDASVWVTRVAVFNTEEQKFEVSYTADNRYRAEEEYSVASLQFDDQRVVDFVSKINREFVRCAQQFYDNAINNLRERFAKDPKQTSAEFSSYHDPDKIRNMMDESFRGVCGFQAVLADGKHSTNTPTISYY